MRALKFIGIAVVVIILLLAIAIGVFISTFDANRYRGLLGDAVERATGRSFVIDGELGLQVWPEIALRAEQVRLSNPKAFATLATADGNNDMLTVAALEATIALQPLLQREVQINGVVLNSPVLTLTTLAEQPNATTPNNNWADLQERFSADNNSTGPNAAAQDSVAANSAQEASVELSSLRIVDGSVSYHSGEDVWYVTNLTGEIEQSDDDAPETSLAVALEGALRGPQHSAPVPIEFDGVVATGDPYRITGEMVTTLALVGMPGEDVVITASAMEVTPDFSQISGNNLLLAVADSDVQLDLVLTDPADTAGLQGRLTTTNANSASWVSLLALELPAGVTPADLGPGNLTTRFEGNIGGALRMNDLQVALPALGLSAQGDVTQEANGNIAGTLSFADINLTALADKLPELIDPDTLTANAVLADAAGSFLWDGKTLELSNTRGGAFGVSFSGRGSVSEEAVESRLSLGEFSPKQVLTYFGVPIETSKPTALTRATADFRLRQSSTETRLEELSSKLDDSTISGWVSTLEAPVPTWRFDLAIDRLNAADYLPPEATEPASTGATASATDPSPLDEASGNEALLGELQLPTEVLRGWDLAGALQVGSLQLFDLQLANLRGQMTLGNGQGTLRGVSLDLYEGQLAGDITFSQRGAEPAKLQIKSELNQIAIEPLLLALADTANFTGKGSVGVDLTGRGNSVLQATQSAAGNITLALADGSFTGVNLGHSLCRLYNQLRSKPLPPDPASNATQFDTFSASAAVSNGEATTNDLRATNSYLQLTGKGRARLARQSIRYDLDVELIGPIDVPNCETLTPYIGSRIPVTLSGTFANPLVRPDFGKLAKREIRRRVEEKITSKLLDLLGGNKPTPEEEQEEQPTP